MIMIFPLASIAGTVRHFPPTLISIVLMVIAWVLFDEGNNRGPSEADQELGLMTNCLHHPQQLLLGPFARFFGHKTNDPWHGRFLSGLRQPVESTAVPAAPNFAQPR